MGPSSQAEDRDPGRRRGNISDGIFQKSTNPRPSRLGKANELGTKKRESEIRDRMNSLRDGPRELGMVVIMQVQVRERTRHNWLGSQMIGIYFLYAEIPSWDNRN